MTTGNASPGAAPASSGPTPSQHKWLVAAGLTLVTVLAYWGIWRLGITNYDDPEIFYEKDYVQQGLAWSSIVWAFTTYHYEYWHPLMWLSHMLDCQLFGTEWGWHHAISLALHVANTVLLFGLFNRMTGMMWRSAVVAALFALHPVHVESVAWLAERKDVLSALFFFLALWAYAVYVEQTRTNGPRRWPAYALALLIFLFGLMTKPMVVTLPFVLLLMDYWPLRRSAECGVRSAEFGVPPSPDESGFSAAGRSAESKAAAAGAGASWPRLVLEKVPFFVLTVLFCGITWYSVKLGDRIRPADEASLSLRLTNIPIAYVRYVWKTICPTNLAVLYPMPAAWETWQVLGAVVVLLGLTGLVLARARKAGYLVFGWFMFLGVLVPTIGLVPVGAQSLADRYMYLPSIGLFAAVVWGIAEISAGWRHRCAVLASVSAVVMVGCGAATWTQTRYWKDSLTLWSHCLAVGYESGIARGNLGSAYDGLGKYPEAIEEYEKARRLSPKIIEVHFNLGVALAKLGRLDEATNSYANALRLKPDYGKGLVNLGLALIHLGDLDGAIAQFKLAIRADPDDDSAYDSLGTAYTLQGNSAQAVLAYQSALRANPKCVPAQLHLGLAFARNGDSAQAIPLLKEAARLVQGNADIRAQVAGGLVRAGEVEDGVAEYREVLRLKPDSPEMLNNLAWLLATHPDAQYRDGREAVRLAERACELTSRSQIVPLGTLAAAYAEAGDFDKAVETSQMACELATAQGEANLLEQNRQLLEQFRDKRAYHEPK